MQELEISRQFTLLSRKLESKAKQPAKYPKVRLPQSPRKIEAGRLL